MVRMRTNAERNVQIWIEQLCEITGKENLSVGGRLGKVEGSFGFVV